MIKRTRLCLPRVMELAAFLDAAWGLVAESDRLLQHVVQALLDAEARRGDAAALAGVVTRLPAQPVLWSRCRNPVLSELRLQLAWLHFFQELGLELGERRRPEELLEKGEQQLEDLAVAALAPYAGTAGAEPFTTVMKADQRGVLMNYLPGAAPPLAQGVTTLPLPARLEHILRSMATQPRLGSLRERWTAHLGLGHLTLPRDELAERLMDKLCETGTWDSYLCLSGLARLAFVGQLCGRMDEREPVVHFE